MKTGFTIALSMLTGAVLGAGAIQGLQAQGKPKAYTVSARRGGDAGYGSNRLAQNQEPEEEEGWGR